MNNDLCLESCDINKLESIRLSGYKFLKRLFDIAASSIVILLILVPTLVIIILVKLSTKETVFYYQNRVGLNGKTFRLYKFRSMVKNADEVLKELLKNDKNLAKEYRKYKKLENDPRITKVGKFLRKTSLDEIPQIFNIFKGDMSFIGSRPYLEKEIEDMNGNEDVILSVKPGLTGYWQAYGRNNTTFEKRVEMEVYYSMNASILFDIKIFFKTILVVLLAKGAK